MKRTSRFLLKAILLLLLPLLLGAGIVLVASHDPIYTLQEWMGWGSFHRYDSLISRAATKYKMDPMLLKSVIWRESRFDPKMVGTSGERGLMQVTDGAARDWADAQKTTPPSPDDLFDPATNIEIGAWYLSRAMQNYATHDDPVPFALAEYNAGRGRVTRWLGENGLEPMSAKQFHDKISIQSTQNYVDTIEDRLRFYKARGRM